MSLARTPSVLKLIVGAGCAAGALIASTAVASADATTEAVVNTTCTYPQIIRALEVQDPAAAADLNASPGVAGFIQSLLAQPPEVRRQQIAPLEGLPIVQQYSATIAQVVGTCNNY